MPDITSIAVYLSVVLTTAPSPGTPAMKYHATCPLPIADTPALASKVQVVECHLTITPVGSREPVRHEVFAYSSGKDNLGELVAQYTRTLD